MEVQTTTGGDAHAHDHDHEHEHEHDHGTPTGEPLTYHVELKSIKKLKLPELDDEFAKDINAKFTSLQELRKDIRRDLEEQNEQRKRKDAVNGIRKSQTEKVPFEVPRTLVMQAIASRIEREDQMLRMYGLNLSQVLGDRVGSWVEAATEGAETSVQASLLVKASGRYAEFTVSDEEMTKEFERLGEKDL